MWIRSQDKTTLVKAKEVNVKQKEKMVFHRRGGEDDMDYELCKEHELYVNDFWFGEYSSEEKAMKVLDMICDAIVSYESSKTEDVGVFTMIFEMPSDDEVE